MIDPRWAWEQYRPTGANPWDLRKAGHLYRRAAFGATWAELQAAVVDGPDTAVEKLLRGREDAGLEARSRELAATAGKFNADGQLAPWWLYRLLSPTRIRCARS